MEVGDTLTVCQSNWKTPLGHDRYPPNNKYAEKINEFYRSKKLSVENSKCGFLNISQADIIFGSENMF